MAKHQIEKRIIPKKVAAHHHKIFTVYKGAPSEHDVFIDFGHKVKYNVVKLSTKDLPHTDDRGYKVRWLTNFGVRNAKGKYLPLVHYTVYLQVRAGASLVVYDLHGWHHFKPQKHERGKPKGTEIVYLDLHSGDPGIGET